VSNESLIWSESVNPEACALTWETNAEGQTYDGSRGTKRRSNVGAAE
jgi:hypothetical protein